MLAYEVCHCGLPYFLNLFSMSPSVSVTLQWNTQSVGSLRYSPTYPTYIYSFNFSFSQLKSLFNDNNRVERDCLDCNSCITTNMQLLFFVGDTLLLISI